MIKSHDLCFEYTNISDDATSQKQTVLCGINLHIQKGEFLAILGRNGSGKSTLARHLNALLTPTSGTLWVNGHDTCMVEHIWGIRQSIGMVFQNPDNQLIATIVEEDVAFGPENLGIPPDEIRARVDESLAAVGMTEYAASAPHHLSGGQKQRIAIAGVLAMRPNCIVLDEPTAMLDPSGRREVLETLSRLNRESGITVILITHFMEEAAQANRVLVMESGKVVKDDTPRNIFKDVSGMKSLGLGVPQMVELTHALIKKGIPVSHDLLTVDAFLQDETVKGICRNQHIINNTESIKENREEASPCEYITIKNLTHIYNPQSIFEKIALDNVNIAIHKGEMIGLIGHTGSGKSTLIQHLNALLKPTSGSIFIDGVDINADKKRLKKIREQVGLVFQYPEHQLFEESVYKDVAFGPTHMGLSESEVDDRVRHALTMVGINEAYYEMSPFDLSGGQKRRVAVAGVLAMRPDILILDEPAAGLDPAGREEILSHIQYMHKEMRNTVILVSHSMEDVARLCSRIIVMNRGRIVCNGTPSEVFSRYGMLHEMGLAVPQINRLMVQLQQMNPSIPTDIFTAEEAAEVLAAYLGKELP